MGSGENLDDREVAIGIEPGAIAINAVSEDEPAYGWVVCMSMHCINGFTWGIIASYGIYLSYYISNDTFEGTSDLSFAFVGGANFATAMACTPLVNVCIRKFGTNIPMYFGAVCFAGGFIAASFASEFWHLVLSQGIMVGVGTGFIWMPATPLLPQWFRRNRSLAQGISAGGSGVGGIIWSFSTVPMIENLGLGWALRITGMCALVVLLTASYLVRDRNEIIRPRIKPLDVQLLKRRQVWMLMGFTAFSMLGYIVLTFTLSSFALSLGLSQDQAGVITGMLNLGTLLGRPFIGVLSDHFGRLTIASLFTFLNAVFTFAIWIPTNSYGLLIFLAIIVGPTAGVFWATITPICAEVVDLKELPSTLAIMWLTVMLPALFSTAIGLELRMPESSRPYLAPQIYTGVAFIIATLFLLEVKRHKMGLWARERHR
ncbi:hypothetical protein B0A52_03308 [Exophiala mesophila]|uniref:Major facilitator superfamily (MFS) profile domain-containing protein n=1 Tax=Exophiala mesophila TaxID=212818 RepID=A0A438NB17_EXOME|nr:hypothetical protein B0A52_03308 [Exophiala mesophila]